MASKGEKTVLTSSQIAAMPVGWKLDALVAEYVLGWLPPGHPKVEAARKRQGMTHNTYDHHYLTPEQEVSRPEKYSTDIEDAWKVIKAIEKREDWNPFLDALRDMNGTDDARDVLQWLFFEISAPLAICRAALLAVEARG